MTAVLHAAAFASGLLLATIALGSAIRIVVLRRLAADWIGRAVFWGRRLRARASRS